MNTTGSPAPETWYTISAPSIHAFSNALSLTTACDIGESPNENILCLSRRYGKPFGCDAKMLSIEAG
jgi:hypothetical protein